MRSRAAISAPELANDSLFSRTRRRTDLYPDMQSFFMALPSAFLFLLLTMFGASAVSSLSVSVEPTLTRDPSQLHRYDFPKDFVFGASTSSHQVEGAVHEGGRGVSIWDTWSHTPGKVDDLSTADVAVDQYHRYEEDIDLLAALNMDAYRFSISWNRIFPDGYGPEVNKEGIDYYNRLIDGLLRRGIKPYVTIFHWDLPQNLQDAYGGWMDRQIVDHYAQFAEACFAAFGDRVKNWITMNEPGLYVEFGYNSSAFPPGRSSQAETEAYKVAHNFLLAHAAAVAIYRAKFQAQQNGVIGITVQATFPIPLTNSSEDKAAAQRSLEFQLSWFLDPLFFGDYPAVMRQNVNSRLPKFSADEMEMLKGSLDFIGINHYSSLWVTSGPGPASVNDKSTLDTDRRVILSPVRDGVDIGPRGASDWLYVVPRGMYGLLKWVSERYNAPIVVTENGMDFERSLSLEDNVRDTRRIQYYQEYLSSALQAIREGADVRGYFAWSLVDCFEWTSGYSKCFGLIYVDHNDGLKRHLKDSALWFQKFLHRNPTSS